MNINEIKKLGGVYVSSDHSSGFDYVELDLRQDVVWVEGVLQDACESIEDYFYNYIPKNKFYLTREDAFYDINEVHYEK